MTRSASGGLRRLWLKLIERRALALICLALAGIAFNGWLAVSNSSTWNVDFNQFYVAGKLAGTGHLYDWTAIKSLEPEQNRKAIPFIRIPAFALAFKPLSSMPYSLARALWLCAGIAALAGFAVLWPFSRRRWACVAICWSAPAAMCLAFGQDTVLFLLFAALGLRLLLRGRDFWAGVAFSMCAAKPHLALLLPVVLAAKLKWRTLAGGLAGGVALLSVSFAAEGAGWPSELLSLARLPEFDTGPGRMPNLRGLLSLFGGSLSIEIALGLAVAVAVWLLARRLPLRSGMALALACGLLMSHHGYVYDAVVLLPALLLPFEEPLPDWVRKWALIVLTPVPYYVFLTDAVWPAHLVVVGYTTALIAALAYGLRRGTPQPAPVDAA